jgi:hypothetical protein
MGDPETHIPFLFILGVFVLILGLKVFKPVIAAHQTDAELTSN